MRALKQRWSENLPCVRRATLIAIVAGLIFWRLPLGQVFVHSSFDLPTVLLSAKAPPNIVMLQIDEPTLTELKQSYQYFSRTNHAALLNKLTEGAARLVVFDVFFPESDPRPAEDAIFAEAIRANGRVVLSADHSPLPGYPAGTVSPPLESLRAAARGWGVSRVSVDGDLTVRRHYAGPESRPSLPLAAADALGAPAPNGDLWLRYYGEQSLPAMSYMTALAQEPSFFRDKIVFIGGKPGTLTLREESDEFATPHTRWSGKVMSGMELQATTFTNLVHGDSLRRIGAIAEFALLGVAGAVVGSLLSLFRPVAALGAAFGAGILLALIAGSLFLFDVWFSWLLIAGVQIPAALACSILWHVQRLQRDKSVLSQQLTRAGLLAPAAGITAAELLRTAEARLGDFKLIRGIGKGAYGEVFLACNAVGVHYALKIVYRTSFPNAEPYEREFRGIQNYMPISLNHPGLAHLVYVGRNDEAGYFYYAMELGDDKRGGPECHAATYVPRTLLQDLKEGRRLSVKQCLDFFLPLSAALEFLHRQRLVHRDIKPSNIIFVRGVPKFADIGLVSDVANAGSDASYVGTEGYIAPEGPGAPAADIYSLGMVLYEAATRLDRKRFPELPEDLPEDDEIVPFMQLNRIILKACHKDTTQRYQSAADLHRDLLELKSKAV